MIRMFGFSGKSDFIRRQGDRVSKGLYLGFTSLGSVSVAMGGAYHSSHEYIETFRLADGFIASFRALFFNADALLTLGVVVFPIGMIGAYLDQDRQRKMLDKAKAEKSSLLSQLTSEESRLKEAKSALNLTQDELQESNSKVTSLHTELVKTWLKSTIKYLSLDTNSRVTIYYEHDNEFYLLTRHSQNPEYAKIHRQKFPLKEGVISKAFQHGEHIEDECPSAVANHEMYVDFLINRYDYTEIKINSLHMNSCRYFARAIKDADEHIGVIVFESTDTDFFITSPLENARDYCEREQSPLSKFIRDSIAYDKEINIKKQGRELSVEDDLLEYMGDVE